MVDRYKEWAAWHGHSADGNPSGKAVHESPLVDVDRREQAPRSIQHFFKVPRCSDEETRGREAGGCLRVWRTFAL